MNYTLKELFQRGKKCFRICDKWQKSQPIFYLFKIKSLASAYLCHFCNFEDAEVVFAILKMLKWSVQSRRASLVDGENQVGALRLPQLFYNQDLSSLCRCVSYVQAEHWPRLIPVGKYTSAHLAGGPPPYTGWVPPARGVSADAA